MCDTDLLGDGIGRQEPDATNVPGQPVWIFRDDSDGVLAIGLENPHGAGRRNAIAMQKNHDLANNLLIGPARGDLSGANFPDPIDLSQPRGRLLNDIEHGGTEGLDQPPGVYRTNTLDHPGAEVALDAGQRVRRRNPDEDRLELSAVLAIRDPCTRCRGVLSWRYGRG